MRQILLNDQIEDKRQEMILTVTLTGISSAQTLLKSRELDDLLNQHLAYAESKPCQREAAN